MIPPLNLSPSMRSSLSSPAKVRTPYFGNTATATETPTVEEKKSTGLWEKTKELGHKVKNGCKVGIKCLRVSHAVFWGAISGLVTAIIPPHIHGIATAIASALGILLFDFGRGFYYGFKGYTVKED